MVTCRKRRQLLFSFFFFSFCNVLSSAVNVFTKCWYDTPFSSCFWVVFPILFSFCCFFFLVWPPPGIEPFFVILGQAPFLGVFLRFFSPPFYEFFFYHSLLFFRSGFFAIGCLIRYLLLSVSFVFLVWFRLFYISILRL